jgi:hypothetical protein
METMKIWHEELIPKLCSAHLWQMWNDGHLIYYLVNGIATTENPELKAMLVEFEGCPLELAFRLERVRQELNKRNPHKLFPLKADIHPFDVTDEPITQYFKEKKRYTPYYSLHQQEKQLLFKKCPCANQLQLVK